MSGSHTWLCVHQECCSRSRILQDPCQVMPVMTVLAYSSVQVFDTTVQVTVQVHH